eukprot:CAMPEP_0171109982 /NCGR_PEP_ID=MMETSP0766_2-20121228/71092_1 /TAXON_ID=439317 /ORGANISM="Gambierdiscus australes, Strain CAWD 149" /LENGTH=80 /DNA_ID=CAMNT_0011571791 /DNA_START=110 /DNA_END=348 /DNA_ORIENTATION=-
MTTVGQLVRAAHRGPEAARTRPRLWRLASQPMALASAPRRPRTKAPRKPPGQAAACCWPTGQGTTPQIKKPAVPPRAQTA